VLVLSGGEPLLRPALVTELCASAHEAGVRVSLISGMFFAAARRPGRAITEALRSVDLVTASVDRFHEREVPRRALLRTLAGLRDEGVEVSLQVTVADGDDGYVPALVADLDSHVSADVPLMVCGLAPIGRGAEIAAGGLGDATARPAPCTLAAWPVVTWDGRITACCNQDVVDGPAPAHLSLGHASTHSWRDVAGGLRRSPLLRSIRTVGPVATAAGAGRACGGYCETCAGLTGVTPDVPEVMEELVVAAQAEMGAAAYAARFGIREHAALVERGWAEVAA